LTDALGGAVMLGDHHAKLLQHVIQLCTEPLEFAIVTQGDRGKDVHVVAQACDVGGQSLKSTPYER